MAQNYYDWASERAITAVAPSPFSYTQGMYKFSDFNHLAAPTSLTCEVCGFFGHTSVECQLGSIVYSPEQVNYAQFNQGFENNQLCFQNPQNLFGQQTTPPSFANNQRGPQKSNLELLLENQIKQSQEIEIQTGILNDSLAKLSCNVDSVCTHIYQEVPQKSSLELLLENAVLGQTEQIQELENQTRFLKDSLAELTFKIDSVVTQNTMLETQLPQVAQQVSQTKTNVVTLRNDRQLEEPPMEDKAKEIEKVSDKAQSEETKVESEKPNIPTPCKPKIPFPQGPAKSKLDEQFRKFVENSEIIQNKLPPKLKDPKNFSIPCVIRSKIIRKAMCDLGTSVSLMPLSLSERMGIG